MPVLVSLSDCVKSLQTVRLVTLLKRDPHTGISEPVVRRCSQRRCSGITNKIHRESLIWSILLRWTTWLI